MPEGESLSFESRKRNALFALLGLAVVGSIATWVFSNSELGYGLTMLLTLVANIVAIIYWCNVDAEERNFDFTLGQRIFIVLFALIGLPYYFVKSRGVRNGLISTGYAFLFWLSMYFVGVVTLVVLSLVEDRLGVFQQPMP